MARLCIYVRRSERYTLELSERIAFSATHLPHIIIVIMTREVDVLGYHLGRIAIWLLGQHQGSYFDEVVTGGSSSSGDG